MAQRLICLSLENEVLHLILTSNAKIMNAASLVNLVHPKNIKILRCKLPNILFDEVDRKWSLGSEQILDVYESPFADARKYILSG